MCPGLESAIYVLFCPRTIVPFVRTIVCKCVSCPLAECAYCGPGKCYSRSKSVVVLDGDCFTCLNSLLVHSLPPVLSVDVKVRLPQCRVSLIHIYHIELNIPHRVEHQQCHACVIAACTLYTHSGKCRLDLC